MQFFKEPDLVKARKKSQVQGNDNFNKNELLIESSLKQLLIVAG